VQVVEVDAGVGSWYPAAAPRVVLHRRHWSLLMVAGEVSSSLAVGNSYPQIGLSAPVSWLILEEET